jgi:transcriptional regulator with PAS, ATPase and Fis domain
MYKEDAQHYAPLDGSKFGADSNESPSRFCGIVGQSEVMRRLYDRVTAAAATRSTILVVGESGTGKELVARALHELGTAPYSPFVPFNCAALPRELVESELFGYRRGSFSGATSDYAGLFRSAEGGTAFLDEITEMSPETQAKLLRTLQERSVRPVGATREVPINVRIIASTNRDPEAAIRSGQLRRDLYYRLQVNVIELPPLRDRRDDIPHLVRHFIKLYGDINARRAAVTGIDEAALDALMNNEWQGNVRELANAIESACTFGRATTIGLADLPRSISTAPRNLMVAARVSERPACLQTFADVERELIQRALASTAGNKVRAARMLKISRKKLYAKIDKYGLERLDEAEPNRMAAMALH